MKHPLQKRLTIIFLLLETIPALFIVGVFYFFTHSQLVEKTSLNLQTVTQFHKDQISLYLEGLSKRTEDFSSDGFIRSTFKTLTKNRTNSKLVKDLSHYLRHYKLSLDHELLQIDVIATNGAILASTQEKIIGKNLSQQEIFIR